MLQRLLKKSVLLFGAVMALCALVMPSTAPAASWSPVGTIDGALDSPDFGFGIAAISSAARCRETQFTANVASAAVLTITSASFKNCHGTVGAAAGCTATVAGTGFPWRATAIDTSNIQIHGVNIDARFETTPPAGSATCAVNGVDVRLTGTLAPAPGSLQTVWHHQRLTVTAASGVTAHTLGSGGLPATVTATIVATGLLNVLD